MTTRKRKAAAVAAMAVAFAFARAAAFAKEATAEAYPDADAVLVEGLEEVAYNPDGTYVADSYTTVKVLTEKGRRDESLISVGYNARYGKAEIVSATVVGEDGSEREIDVAATTNETTDNSSVSSNIYDPMHRKVVCAIPGVKVGDEIRYHTRRRILKSRVKDLFADIEIMEWSCPIQKQTFRVTSPASLPLKRVAVRNPLGNVEYAERRLADGSVVHEWTAAESPQAFPEPDMPPLSSVVQTVHVSTAEDWPQISRWYWDLCQAHLAKTTPAISNRVAEIAAALPAGADASARLAAVYKWVAQEIRYMGLTMEDTSPGYAPHDVDITFDNRYGVCRDKAALLTAMLRIAGFEAYPVLIHAGAKMDPEVPMPYFNHAITAVRAPGDPAANSDGFILMDSTDESSRDLLPAYLGDRSYLVATPWGETLHTSPVAPASENALAVKTKGTLQRDGSMVAESSLVFKGINDNVYRHSMLRRTPDERRAAFERILRFSIPGAELLSFEIEPKDLRETEKEYRVTLLYRIGETLLKGETRDELSVPFASRSFGAANWLLDGSTSLESRRYPLVVSSTAMTDETVEIDLGGALGGKASLPDKARIATGPYSFLREFAVKDGVLTARRTHSVGAVEFSPDEYLDLREDVKRVEAVERGNPVFTKNEYADANVRVLRTESDCTVFNPTAWIVTNTVEKEILTYDGKKRSAELKYSFNPTWKTVEVVSAVVSNRTGGVSAAGARETTLLDCGWAASAPRYPAGKDLVVNLPSVEIGSVITYTVVTTVTNAPAPFHATWNFDVAEPTDFLAVRYRNLATGEEWEREVAHPRRIPREAMQPAALLWRDTATVALGDFGDAADALARAADVPALKRGEAHDAAAAEKGGEAKIRAVRDWMAKHVRVAGPSLWETPLDAQLTDPATVVEERYATRLDYVRTTCAILKGLGFDASVVFASADSHDDPALVAKDLANRNVRKFASALCRVDVREGGFMGVGRRRATYFIGTENEYTPLAASAYAGGSVLDPAKGGAIVRAEAAQGFLAPRTAELYDIELRSNGSAYIDYSKTIEGPAVGAFRKTYAEMLPEDRSRHFQALLGGIAQAASATRELLTDVESYPATLSFSAYVPDYATIANGAMTLKLPEIGGALFSLTGAVRESPLAVPASPGVATATVRVKFPAGYGEIEHVPEDEDFRTGDGGSATAFRSVKTKVEKDDEGRLVVTVEETMPDRTATSLPAPYLSLLKEWSRRSSTRSARTVVVR